MTTRLKLHEQSQPADEMQRSKIHPSYEEQGLVSTRTKGSYWAIIGVAIALLAVVTIDRTISSQQFDWWLLLLTSLLCVGASLYEGLVPGRFSLQVTVIFFLWAIDLEPAWTVAVLTAAVVLPGVLLGRWAWQQGAIIATAYILGGLTAFGTVQIFGPLEGIIKVPPILVMGLLLAAITFVFVVRTTLVILESLILEHNKLRAAKWEILYDVHINIGLACIGALLAVLWNRNPALAPLMVAPLLLISRLRHVPALEQQANTDPKTGLANPTFFNKKLEDEFLIAHNRTLNNQQAELSLAMIDLDHLRRINNNHGHQVGDYIICAVAEVIRKHCPKNAVSARFGGEEYSLLLPGINLDRTQQIVEAIREEVAQHTWKYGNERLFVSLSAGVASYPRHGTSPRELTQAADAAVYDAKLSGRNRTCIALTDASRQMLGIPSPITGGATMPTPTVKLLEPESSGSGYFTRPASVNPQFQAALHQKPSSPITRRSPQLPLNLFNPTGNEQLKVKAGPKKASRYKHLLIPYVAALSIATVLLGIFTKHQFPPHMLLVLVILVALVVVFDLIRIDVFGRTTVSPAVAPAIALAYFLGPWGPITANAIVVAIQILRRAEPARWLFNFGGLSLAGIASAGIFAIHHETQPILIFLTITVLACITNYVVNAGLLATWVSLKFGERPSQIWRDQILWTLPHYIGFGIIVSIFILGIQTVGPMAIAPFVLLLLTSWLGQSQYVRHIRDSMTRLQQAKRHLEEANHQQELLLDDQQELAMRLYQSSINTLSALARAIEAKDPYTGNHTERVAKGTVELAQEFDFSDLDLQAIAVGAVLHDIGKIGVPDEVLLKQGKLTESEFQAMAQHPKISSYIVAELDLPPIVKQMVRSHHERYDGMGYPDLLAGEDIPLVARILAVIDTFDAMTNDRPYRPALTTAEAVSEIIDYAGTQFCPQVARAFHACVKRNPQQWGDLEDENPFMPAFMG